MKPMNDHLRQAEHDELARQIAAWEAQPGNNIERLPRGLCNWDALSDRAKINPQVDYAEREARKAADAAVPAPKKPERAPKPAKAPKPPRPQKVAAPRPPKPMRPPKVPKVKIAPAGSQKARLLAALGHGWTRVSDLHAATGIHKAAIREHLAKLQARGYVEATGTHLDRQWRKAEGEPPPPQPPQRRPRTGLAVQALEAVRAGCQTVGDIAARTGGDRRSLSVILSRLQRDGLIACTGNTSAARWSQVDAADR